jgi:hypothetical protein
MGHVHLHVGDLPEAERFYRKALGLDKTVWSLSGSPVPVCRQISPSPWDERLVSGTITDA